MPTTPQPNFSTYQAFLNEARQLASQTPYAAQDKRLEKQGVKQAAYASHLTPDEPNPPVTHERLVGQKPTSPDKGRLGPLSGDHQSDGEFAEFLQDLEAATFQLSHDKAIEPLAFDALLKRFEDQQAFHDEAVSEAKKLAAIAITAAFVTVPWARCLKQ
jgi:hypothetical protein